MSRLTRDRSCLKHDDLIDVLAMAVTYWTNYLGQDIILAERGAKDERLAIELESFMESTIGHKVNKGSWI